MNKSGGVPAMINPHDAQSIAEGGVRENTLESVCDLAKKIVWLVEGCEPKREEFVVFNFSEKSRIHIASRLVKERKDRKKFWDSDLFGEPVWDILLDLYVRDTLGQPTSITSSCIASGVPSTTALRYIQLLEREGLVARRADIADARRNFLGLSDTGRQLLDNYLDSISR